jgi:hypothetical protein
VESNTWIAPDGKFDTAAAPADIKPILEAKKWEAVTDVFKSYKDLEGFVGQKDKMLTLPDEGDAEGWGKVYNKLGRPETPDKYEFTGPEGVEIDNGVLGEFKKFAHEKGFNGKQFTDTVNFQIAMAQKIQEQQKAQAEAAQAEFRAQFKTEQEFEDVTKGAFRAAERVGLGDIIEKYGMQHDAAAMRALRELDRKLSNDVVPAAPTANAKSKEEQIKELTRSDAYTQSRHPDHASTVRQVIALVTGG